MFPMRTVELAHAEDFDGWRAAARTLALAGVPADEVHAVAIRFDDDCAFAGLDGDQPLATQGGKPAVVRALALAAPVLAVGDGSTDAAIRPEVAAFAAYVGFARRPAVVRQADHVLHGFDELRTLVLP